jgi:hypothetical protein
MRGEKIMKKNTGRIVTLFVLVSAIFVIRPDFGESRQVSDTALRPAINKAFGKLPRSFEMNCGQTDSKVRFLSRGKYHTLFLTQKETVLVLMRERGHSHQHGGYHAHHDTHRHDFPVRTQSALHIRLVDANPAPSIVGLEEMPGRINYFIGERKNWRTGIPRYKKVKYKGIYPGIDLVYYDHEGELEHDFIVAPGADPNTILLSFKGTSKVSLDKKGNLNLRTALGNVLLRAPAVYQKVDGKKQKIEGTYRILGKDRVGFHIASYDLKKELVIDPVLSYSTFLGGDQWETGYGIAVDSSGNAYVTGITSSYGFPTAPGVFPTTPGAYNRTCEANGDVFVTKFNPQGSDLIYSTLLGGTGYDWSHTLVLDPDGNAYVTGYTKSSDFPTTSNAYQKVKGGGASNIEDTFVTKLNASGSGLLYSTFLGGDGAEQGQGIALDADRNIYLTGKTHSTNFPTTQGAYDTVVNGNGDAYVSKLDITQTGAAQLVYSTYLGGTLQEYGYGIALDSDRNAYVTGQTESNNFPTMNPFQGTSGSPTSNIADAFVTKLNPSGSNLVFSTYLGGAGWDWGHGITVDSEGSVYVTGGTPSEDFPTKNAYQGSHASGGDAFVAQFETSGTGLVFSTYLGGSEYEMGYGVALDAAGNIYVAGETLSSDFPMVNPVQSQICQGCTNVSSPDAFLAQFNPTASSLLFSTFLGGIDYDWAHAIALDEVVNAYLVGQTWSQDFPVTLNAYQQTKGGGAGNIPDAFAAKISMGGGKGTISGILFLLLGGN